jgi:excisionase family DNA binding protein
MKTGTQSPKAVNEPRAPGKKTIARPKSQSARAAVLQAIRAEAGDATTISVEAAGRLLGLRRDTAYAAAKENRLPTIKVAPRRWRVPVAAIERMLLGE